MSYLEICSSYTYSTKPYISKSHITYSNQNEGNTTWKIQHRTGISRPWFLVLPSWPLVNGKVTGDLAKSFIPDLTLTSVKDNKPQPWTGRSHRSEAISLHKENIAPSTSSNQTAACKKQVLYPQPSHSSINAYQNSFIYEYSFALLFQKYHKLYLHS